MTVPTHIAIIMDGNGRWATRQGMPRFKGHVQGYKNLRNILKAASDMGVKYLTVYAFSSENFKRP
ncbi:MAG: undecaprenyl diphosphate synthase family protein, partial [Abditibacteriota bacterium]|nr:undecaprenyl diphosphate synthase family protein [Abditibacteriota bacterium]